MNRKIYCIGGVGADEQIFSKLNLPAAELVTLKWLIPFKAETITSYAQRMMQQINETEPVLIGVSFGGIMAVEMAKLFSVKKIFLISSVKHKDEKPFWMKILSKVQLHRLLNPRPHPLLYPIENYFLGANEKDSKKMASAYRKQVNPVYLQWAIHEIICWQNVTIPTNLIHIHGAADKIFPLRNMKADYTVLQGNHFMVYTKAEVINTIIHRELEIIS